jgi:hypothetical protein
MSGYFGGGELPDAFPDFVTVTEDDFVQLKLLFKYKRVELFGL